MHRVQPSSAPFTYSRSLYFTLGTLRSDNSDASENVWKTDLPSFQTFSRLFKLDQSFKSWQIKLGAEERWPRSNSERYSRIYPFHVRKRTSNLVISSRSCAGTATKLTEKRDAWCIYRVVVVFLLFLFLTFSLPSPSWFRKVPNK